MFRKAIILSLAVVLALAWLPGSAAAQRSNTLTISIWNGEGSAHQQYQANTATRVRLYYYWYARTEQQVEDFVSRAKFDITLDGETVFNSAAEADAAWQPVEPFTFNGAQIKRAQWSFDLPALTPGQHTIRTIISLDTAVEDGVAPTPFGPGAVHNTTNIVTVYSGQVPSQPAASTAPAAAPAQPAAPAAPAQPAAPSPPTQVYSDPAAGTFIKEAYAYWAPEEGKLVSPTIVFKPGMSLWVFGMDSTYRYYQVMLDAALIWVRAETIGPTNDDVWHNNPLPNIVVH